MDEHTGISKSTQALRFQESSNSRLLLLFFIFLKLPNSFTFCLCRMWTQTCKHKLTHSRLMSMLGRKTETMIGCSSTKFLRAWSLTNCVCAHTHVQSMRLQALMRQSAFLFLWPPSKHIKSYLISAYTAMSAHTKDTHIKHRPKYTYTQPEAQNNSTDTKHTKFACKLSKCH